MSTNAEHAFAVVQSVEADGLRLKFDGEETAGEKSYKCNTFFKFAPGDRVYCVKDSGTFVAICKIGEPAQTITVDRVDSVKDATFAQYVRKYKDTSGYVTFSTFEEYDIPAVEIGYEKFVPLLSAFDCSTNEYFTSPYILFRSNANGELEYLARTRQNEWKTLTNK